MRLYEVSRPSSYFDIQMAMHRDIPRILIIKVNEMHYFSNLFDKVL
jgi:hypothetical protein